MIKLSKFFQEQKVEEDVYAIFNSLIMDVIFLNKNELQNVKNLSFTEDVKQKLLTRGIIIDNESDDDIVLDQYRKEIRSKCGKIENVYVILTNKCNLRCKYCAIKNVADLSNVPTDKNSMQYDIIDEFIIKYVKYVQKNNIKSPTLIFYGGEPLLCIEKIKYIIKKTSDYKFKYTIVTNGTMITDELADLCSEYNVSVGISIDGPQEINDKNRVFATHEGSVYDVVLEKLHRLQGKVDYNLSITITDYMLDNKDAFFEWLKSICSKYGINTIAYNLLRFQNEHFDMIEYNRKAIKFLIDSYNLTQNDIYEDRIGRKIRSFLNGTFYYADCSALTENQIVIKPNGDLTVCQAFCQGNTDIIGNIKNVEFDDVDKSVIKRKYSTVIPITSERCLKCPALYICGGGCYWEAQKNEEHLDVGFCEHSKEAQKWLIGELYKISVKKEEYE